MTSLTPALQLHIQASPHIVNGFCSSPDLYLQALVKYLDNVSGTDITKLEISTGVPLVYELDEALKPVRHYFVG